MISKYRRRKRHHRAPWTRRISQWQEASQARDASMLSQLPYASVFCSPFQPSFFFFLVSDPLPQSTTCITIPATCLKDAFPLSSLLPTTPMLPRGSPAMTCKCFPSPFSVQIILLGFYQPSTTVPFFFVCFFCFFFFGRRHNLYRIAVFLVVMVVVFLAGLLGYTYCIAR
jgi:hypothetical protein